jgi:hypothetical protein
MWSTLNKSMEIIGSLLPGNAAVNMYPQQWETVFSVGSMQKSYLKNKRHYEFSSEFSVEVSHGKFVVEEEYEVGM